MEIHAINVLRKGLYFDFLFRQPPYLLPGAVIIAAIAEKFSVRGPKNLNTALRSASRPW